ncbi:MAG: MopE-related protein [Saprospiraceae bacterium]
MKCSFYQRLITFAALCLLFSAGGFAQKNSRISGGSPAKEFTRRITNTPPTLRVEASKPSPVLIGGICDDDQIAPQINCPAGNCQPFARAAYLTSISGEPWGQADNYYAMDAVFGSGNWDALALENTDAASLISPNYKVLFLEGSEGSGYVLDAFLSANLPALENWVSAGGALFINCAPNSAPSAINYGFGGVTLQSFIYFSEATVQIPGHPIFNGPFVPANGNFTGSSFSHATILGPSGLPLITDASGTNVLLSEKSWDSGKVFFGAMTMPAFHGPAPNALNMRQNILANLNELCNAGLIVAADAGTCWATVLDASLDATASDDCVLASLTHDFAGAPSNTTLSGAVLPAGNTLVRWTATDEAGNTNTCETLISVRETEPPVINCSGDITVTADPGICGATLTHGVTATDNCTATPLISTYPATGSIVPNGTTYVQATATDASFNQSFCYFYITVIPHPEICNGIDDDCDGWTDEDVTDLITYYLDADYDGYGTPDQTTTGFGCYPPWGYSLNALDCNDSNYYVNPGMGEYCNGIDDNCDGNIDEGVAPTWYADADGDGYGDLNQTITSCNPPQGYVYNNWDCSDTDAYIHPNALEDCTNLTDENCDGILGDNNFTIDEVHTDVFCGSNPDGTISITVSPAQNYPVILWSNGSCCTTNLSNLDFGTYKVTVTNECGTSKTKTIVIQPSAELPLQVALSGTDYICGGTSDGQINASPSDGCGGYTFQWNTGSTDASISGLTGGYYEVVVTDACGCTRAVGFTINQSEQLGLYVNNVIPLLDGTYYVDVYPYGGAPSYKFRRSTPPSGYTDWSPSNGFLGLPSGEYVFEVEDANACMAQTSIVLSPLAPRPVEPQDGTAKETATENRSNQTNLVPVQGAWDLTLFPNPNTGNFKVDMLQPATSGMSFGISDQSGRLLLEKQVEPDSQIQTVNAEALPAGIYFLQVVSQGKVVAVKKFVKE